MGKGERTEKQRIGAIGESIAETFLLKKGYTIHGRNYRRPWGEIDIIAEKEGIVRFVEVKTVSKDFSAHHRPEEMVDERKLAKLARTAELYMAHANDDREFQLDVVGIIIDVPSRTARCRLIEQAL